LSVLIPGGYAYDFATDNTYDPTFTTGANPYTSPVGYFAPNGYGLYDMGGNVWQSCWDWYGIYGSASQTDPRGPTTGYNRVLRGGSFDDLAFGCRSAVRGGSGPSGGDYHIGFRCALAVGQ
jgi:formylglycine-generating enzyme required for sulfatase activity